MGADELVVMRDGYTVVNWASGQHAPPHQIMSITKSIVALAVGGLVDDGRLHLDDPPEKFFPRLSGDPRGAITVEQVLTMTSGLGSSFPHGDVDDDCIEEALLQPREHAPGRHLSHNNDAVNLLSGIDERLTGVTLRADVNGVLFEPLGISNWTWGV